jgi:predicted MFS family arabinose efflux permease
MNFPLLALAAAAFGIGTTDFVIMGLLPEVAQDFGVSAPSAGMLVSGYAFGVTIGAPVLAVLTARWPRKKALLALMGLFNLGNATGAWLGGLLIASGRPLTQLPWLGALVALLALGVVALSARLDQLTPRAATSAV